MKITNKNTLSNILIKLVLISFVFSFSFANAQTTTDSVRLEINNILSPLNKAQIPTGILAENSYSFFELSNFNGQLSTDNNIDLAQWRLLYIQALSGAFVAPATLPNTDQLVTDYNTASSNGAANVVSLALINYASIKPDALTLGLLTTSNGQLFNVVGATSPYLINSLFIAAGGRATAKYGKYSIVFKPSLFYTNTGLTVSSLAVNFDNGAGFVAASFNTPLTGSYTSTGNKKLIYKITFSNGTIAQCYNTIYVDKVTANNAVARYAEPNTNPDGSLIPDVDIPATAAHSGADLFIRRASIANPGSNTNPQFRKPLIVVEGFDLSSGTTVLGNGYNYNDFRDEIININKTGFIVTPNPNTRAFDEYLDDVAGYDLIFVNYKNGTDDILRNALMLRDVINYVNARKLPGAQQNVIMGISMGGLVSRYCLAQMVKAGQNPQTRLLITHDSPHQGANIPLALQHLLQGIRKQRISAFLGIYNKRLDEVIPKLQDVNTLLNCPAATQQLLARVIDDNGTVATNNFLAGQYRTMVNFAGTGFVQPYRMIATSQGSQCGTPVLAPYSVLANLDAEGKFILFGLSLWTKGRTFINMRALPNTGQTTRILDFNLKLKIKFLIFNILKTSMEIKQNAPNNLPALDGLAGGTRDLGGTEGTAAVSSLPRASGFAYWISFLYSFNFNTPVIAPRFSFVNTASALDITNANATNVPYVFPVNGANGSRADKYIAQEPFNFVGSLGSTSNVNHTDFYARTCNWLFNEMETQPDNISCSNINECYATDIAIQQNICNGIKSYKVTNVPATSIVSWTAVPSTGYQLITSGNSATIYCNQNLSIALTANYTDYCGTAQTITRNFVFSLPTATLNTTIIDNTTSNWCTGIAHTLTILAQNQLEVYNWIVPSPLFTVLSSSGNTAQILYNGGGNANTNIQCNITSYCYKPATVNFTVPLLKMGDNITKTIQAELVDQSTLQTVNNIADNNATVQILVPSNPTNVAVYSLLNGQPEAFGYFGNGSGLNTNVMSIYNRSGGSYNISASVLNGCNTQVIIPFTINLTNARYNYPFIFTIAPNPVLSTTTVTVNLQNISNSVLQSCLLGGGNIRVEVFNFNTGLLVNTINAPALATSVAVNMNGYPAGMYTFRITGLNCAGFYQEVQQVIKQ